MTMKGLLVVVATTAMTSSLWAAKPKNIFSLERSKLKSSASMKQEVVTALQLPLENRLKVLKKLGKKTYPALVEVAFDSKQPLQPRWRAITSLGRVFPRLSKSVIDKASRSSEWFLRNSAVIAMEFGDRNWAIERCMELMHDKALIVRTAAAQTLKKLKARRAETLLWRKLYSQENYKKGKSLWVRKYIAEALASMAHFGQEQKFVQMLSDPDTRLHPSAVKALEKITKNAIGLKKAPLKKKRKQWLAWWQTHKNS